MKILFNECDNCLAREYTERVSLVNEAGQIFEKDLCATCADELFVDARAMNLNLDFQLEVEVEVDDRPLTCGTCGKTWPTEKGVAGHCKRTNHSR